MPEDLRHEGKAAALEFDTIEGSHEQVLDARIVQYPFAGDGSEQPHMELMPEAGSGGSTGYLSASEFNAEIRRAQRHLTSLLHLSEQLAAARAVAHEHWVASPALRTGSSQPWLSIDNGDIETMPVDYLLRVFGVKVVEVDDDSRPADQLAVLSGKPGAMTLSFKWCVPQVMREQLTRVELLKKPRCRRCWGRRAGPGAGVLLTEALGQPGQQTTYVRDLAGRIGELRATMRAAVSRSSTAPRPRSSSDRLRPAARPRRGAPDPASISGELKMTTREASPRSPPPTSTTTPRC